MEVLVGQGTNTNVSSRVFGPLAIDPATELSPAPATAGLGRILHEDSESQTETSFQV